MNAPETLIGFTIGVPPLKPISADRQETAASTRASTASEKFKIRLASSDGQRQAATLLIEKMYSWRGYIPKQKRRPTPNQCTLVASTNDQIIGTVTLTIDSPAGLLAENLYGEELAALRAKGAKLYELTQFAVEESSSWSKRVVASFFHITYIYGRRFHGCTDVIIEVNPRHVPFYTKLLGFQPLGPERICPRVNAPAILLHLDLAYVEAQVNAYGGLMRHQPGVRSLYPYFFSKQDEQGIIHRLSR